MKKVYFVLPITFMALLLTACGPGCPDTQGNYVQLKGAYFDTLYNEIQFLPANITEDGDPGYYNRINKSCQWCLPVDIASPQTIYVLRGNTRTDTVTINYNVVLEYRENNCGYQAAVHNLTATSTFTNQSLLLIDTELRTWELWVDF